MTVITNRDAGAVRGEPVTGDRDPGDGGDVEMLGTDRPGHRHGRAGEFGWYGVPVTAVGDQRLPRRDPGLDQQHRIRHRRDLLEGFGGGDGGHAGPTVGRGGAQASVASDRGEPVAVGLDLLHGQLVGHGAPPALRRGVVDLLHHPFAMPGTGWADRHGDAVVLRDAGERGGDPTRLGMADGGHPVEPPHPAHPTQGA